MRIQAIVGHEFGKCQHVFIHYKVFTLFVSFALCYERVCNAGALAYYCRALTQVVKLFVLFEFGTLGYPLAPAVHGVCQLLRVYVAARLVEVVRGVLDKLLLRLVYLLPALGYHLVVR